MAGSSNFGSWVRIATASGGPSPSCSAASSGHPTIDLVGVGEALVGHERRAPVDDRGPVAQLARHAGQRDRGLDGADDDEPRADREGLDEELTAADR